MQNLRNFVLFKNPKFLSASSIRSVSAKARSMDFNIRKEVPLKHLFDGGDLNVYDTKIINLSAGTPSERLLRDCCDIFKTATDHRMNYERENSSFLFQYGPTVGSIQFRTKLAEFLSEGYKSEVFASDLVLTAGSTYGLHQILTTLIGQDGFIFLDDVTYMIALEAIAQFPSLKIIPIKLNSNGVDIEDLESKVAERKFEAKGKMFWADYTIPTFHNPTGILFSEEIQTALIKIARKHDILIICKFREVQPLKNWVKGCISKLGDDVYNLLPFEADPPKRLFAYDSFGDTDFKGNVISNGTFSKILSPGVRIGWMECSPRIIDAFRNSGVLKSGGAINNYTSGLLTSLIELGLAKKQLQKCLKTYKEQCDALCETLEENLDPSCSFVKPAGGYFIWLKLPENIDGDALSAFCLKKHKVFAIRGSRFSVEKKFRNFIRLSFAFHPPEILREAGRRFCNGVGEYLQAN